MKILYLLTSPEPVVPGTDAVFQEVAALRAVTGGDVLNLFPLARPTRFLPSRLLGIQSVSELDRLNRDYDLFHVYHPQLQVFHFLKQLKKPIVYSVVAGLGSQRRPPSRRGMRGVHTVVISNERDKAVLERWGIRNHRLVRSGIDTTRLTPAPPPGGGDFTLLVGSAPWTRGQFAGKGVNALLAAAAALPDVSLVFLWRGRHRALLQRRIAAAGLDQRVEVINEHVDVNRVLARVHATVVLAGNAKLVKAYPHSLMESLAAARPVLVSRAIPMADYVAEKGCGIVVDTLSPACVAGSIQDCRARYARLRQGLPEAVSPDIGMARLVEDYTRLYRACL